MSIKKLTDKFLPVLQHLTIWIILAIILYQNLQVKNARLFFIIFGLFPGLLMFYANYLFLVPTILARLKILSFIFFNLILLSFVVFAFTFAFMNTDGGHTSFGSTGIGFAKHCLLFVLLSIIIRFSVDWFGHKLLEKQRENEHLKTELTFLKAQVNPHFLFNSLNNLYALALKQSPDTPEMILRISKIMRYLLYETNEKTVLLSKEIELLDNYISLQLFRNKEKKKYPFSVNGNEAIPVAPLLFLPIVENVFKHGTDPLLISLTITNDHLVFETKNKIRTDKKITIGGVGLKNLKRRLELLYPNNHFLELDENDGTFMSKITINFTK